jgi:phosphoglycerate dehydrogenase-like enzyme
MTREPEVLVLHEMPPETTEDIGVLTSRIRKQLPRINLRTAADYEDGLSKMETAEVVLSHTATSEHLDNADRLQWIQTLSSGVDHYNLDRLEEMDVRVTSASSANADAVAEHAVALMLGFERNLHDYLRQQERKEWRLETSGELGDKTVGLLGVGEIGGRVAELAAAFRMEVLGMKRDPTSVPAPVDEVYGPDDLHTVLGRSDYIVVACPLTEDTRNMLAFKEFTSMKNSGVLINVARGPILNEYHLAVAVQRGFLRGAGLDVFEDEPLPQASPLWNLSDVIVTPHAAGTTSNYLRGCADVFAENYTRYVEGDTEEMTNRVT